MIRRGTRRPPAVSALVVAMMFIHTIVRSPLPSSKLSTPLLLRGAHAFAVPRRSVLLKSQCPNSSATHWHHLLLSFSPNLRHRYIHRASNADEISDQSTTADSSTLTMERIYSEWSLEDDQLLYDNRHLSTVRRASLLGRGMHGVEARLKKLSDVDSTAYARLFGTGNASMHNDGEDDDADKNNKKLTPVKEVLRRIQWDPTLLPSSFTIVHYDRVEDNLCETPFDAPNDSISGKETQFVFALPEHRIERVKYLDRVIWDKEMRLDAVFGSMNGNGMTIDQVIETYDEWKKEKEEREERNRRREMQILGELNLILGEMRMDVLKELSSQLLHNQWETEEIRDYVKRVVGLYHDAKRGNEQDDSIEGSLETKADFIEVVDFLYVLSDLVALLKDALLREEILKELEVAINRSLGESGSSTTMQPGATLPELKEEDLDEKFVKGSGAGGQKVNKTSNRVILLHVPTQIRVECQDTRSLQQNRKIARKRLRLKVDAFLNGESSRTSQKASAAVAKKAKNKSRNKRRRQQKKKKSSDEST